MNERRLIARKSVMIGSLEQFTSYILSFITRRVILLSIGVEYLGLNSTLSQILGALSVTELGIQGVIIYRLYRPVVEDDREAICELMSVIRYFYRIVASVIFVGAIILLPFLKWLIKDISIPWEQINMAWLMMAASSALSYLMNYNSTILFADQKQYLYQRIHLVLNIIIVSINLLLLHYAKNYFLYLLFMMINTMAGNVVLLILRYRLYPWIRYVRTSKSLAREVAGSTMDIFVGRISGYIFNSTDNIVISALIGTAMVGYVGNYTTISQAVSFFISNISGPVQALVGNMLAEGLNTDLNGFVKRYTYALYAAGTVLIIPTALLLNDFVALLYGSQYVMGNIIICLLTAELYIAVAQTSVGTMLDADGQFHIERRFYIISSFINIILSVAGALTIGVYGIILGTVVGRLYLWVSRAYYCYKYVIKDSGQGLFNYYLYHGRLLSVFLGQMILLKLIYEKWFSCVSVPMFFLKGFLAVGIAAGVQFVVFGRTQEFRYVLGLIGLDKVKRK